jgi:hypothetical protein
MTTPFAQAADLPSSSRFARPLPRDEFPEQGMRPRDAFDLIHLGLRRLPVLHNRQRAGRGAMRERETDPARRLGPYSRASTGGWR